MKTLNGGIKAVLFDFDGTLTEPGALDFAAVREAVGCGPSQPILEFIEGIPDEEKRQAALQTLDRLEIEAAARSRPNAGSERLVKFLRHNGLKVGIVSRNSLRSIEIALANFGSLRAADFDVVLTRDDPIPPKPSPAGIRDAAERMGVPVGQVLVVGDYVYDIEAGCRAGARTAFLTNRGRLACGAPPPDFTVGGLEDIEEIVGLCLPLRQGKLPNRMLRRFLSELSVVGDPSVILGPRVGEDVAAVLLEGEEVLVLKSDPITFATDSMGRYAVIVNANDVATCGARPRWLLSSLLFPPGSTAMDIQEVMRDLAAVAAGIGATVCGGHTEITDAVTRPVAVCQVAGTVSRSRLIDKRRMGPGDQVMVTKGVALEGCSIIAREFAAELDKRGVPPSVAARCRGFLDDPGISILEEARISAESAGVSAMHDVTEGGIATAIEELSAAGGHRIRVDVDAIPVLPETGLICRSLGIDPLGLIASGSLLIACRPDASQDLMRRLRDGCIPVASIGEVLGPGEGVEAIGGGRWRSFEVDEITRLYSGRGA